MHIEYQISESDYVAAVRLCRRAGERTALLRIYVLPAMCALLTLPLAIMLFAWQGLALELVPAILFLLCPLLDMLLWRNKVSLRYRDNLSLHRRNFVDIDDRGFRMRDVATDRFTPWSEISAYAESRTTFIRFQDRCGQFHITPKRELTELQISEFRQMLASRLPRRGARQAFTAAAQAVAVAGVVVPILWLAAPPLLRR